MNRIGLAALAVIVVACLGVAVAAEPPPAAAATESLLSKPEAKGVDGVVDAMLAAGFPDAKGATVYCGKLDVSATFDPAKTPPPLPSDASRTQMTQPNSNQVTYGYEFNGLHFKLPEGSWIIALAYRFKPGPNDKVNTAGASELNLAEIIPDALKAHPFDAEHNAAGWLERVGPAERARDVKIMDRLVPVTMFLKVNSDGLAPAVVLLRRAGWEAAGELSLALAQQRARNYWQLKPWTTPDMAFDPTGAYPNAKAEQEAWANAHAHFTSEPPQVALRRGLFRWCRGQMMAPEPEDRLLTLDVAAACAKAAVDPKDPQGNAARIDALLAGCRLPVTPPEHADLATRLASWELRPRMPRMVVSGGHAGLSINTAFTAPPPAYTPDKADLDALVALLADERPSRCADFSGPRTVGDNAWRAVATLLGSDPRALAGYPTDRPWTADERRAAAKAVQAWWQTHRGEHIGK
ncbi:MAG TPA: hypothetical protein VGI81_17095 [Tepidisphaeraceae bacterium]